jgi:very-short-patch-repair endonuclease
MKPKTCPNCQKEFTPKDYRRECCSYSCARYWWGKHNEPLHTWLGRKRSPENCKNISEGTKRAWADPVKKENMRNNGRRIISAEEIKRRTASWKKFYSENPSFMADCLRRRPVSSLEQRYINIFQELNIPARFVGNGELMIGRRNPDFVFEDKRVVVEVYYRRHKEYLRGKSIDVWQSQRTDFFKSYGWETVYLDETESYKDKVLSKFMELGLVEG